ncbi:MAG: hypothetical protein ACOY5U_02660 [Pseudomonadota bacterium]
MSIVLLAAAAGPALAGPIEAACLRSERSGGNRAICGCIQQVADMTLTGSDQRLAARFFSDPDRAQEIRQSDRRSHEAFWERYRNFGETAEVYCGG